MEDLNTADRQRGHASAGSTGLSSAAREYLEENEAGLRALARSVEADREVGQIRMFSVLEEWPELAAAAE